MRQKSGKSLESQMLGLIAVGGLGKGARAGAGKKNRRRKKQSI